MTLFASDLDYRPVTLVAYSGEESFTVWSQDPTALNSYDELAGVYYHQEEAGEYWESVTDQDAFGGAYRVMEFRMYYPSHCWTARASPSGSLTSSSCWTATPAKCSSRTWPPPWPSSAASCWAPPPPGRLRGGGRPGGRGQPPCPSGKTQTGKIAPSPRPGVIFVRKPGKSRLTDAAGGDKI